MGREGPAEVRRVMDKVFEEAAVSMESLAEEAGISYATLHAWRTGRRNPSRENLRALAAALRRRSAKLAELAEEVDDLAGGDR